MADIETAFGDVSDDLYMTRPVSLTWIQAQVLTESHRRSFLETDLSFVHRPNVIHRVGWHLISGKLINGGHLNGNPSDT